MAALRGGWHPERMSLITDALAVGAAFAVAVGSAVQAKQAYDQLNEKTPARNSLIPLRLIVIAIRVWFSILIPVAAVAPSVLFIRIGLLTSTPTELTPEQVAALPPGQAAVLADGKATALTTDQAVALSAGNPIGLTTDQVAAMTAERVKDMKKWLGWLVGWLFILLGALVALAGAALTLTNDL